MSDLRYDPVSGHWVTIAKNRLDRPMEFIPLEQVRQQLICPFCRGNEDQTPADIAAYLENGRAVGRSPRPCQLDCASDSQQVSFVCESMTENGQDPYRSCRRKRATAFGSFPPTGI